MEQWKQAPEPLWVHLFHALDDAERDRVWSDIVRGIPEQTHALVAVDYLQEELGNFKHRTAQKDRRYGLPCDILEAFLTEEEQPVGEAPGRPGGMERFLQWVRARLEVEPDLAADMDWHLPEARRWAEGIAPR